MSAVQTVEQLLSQLTDSEKAQVLQTLARDLADPIPGIERTPSVVGGSARIVGTRIPVWLLEEARRDGATEADLLLAYPFLRAEDLVNAWSYVKSHREEIDHEIRENEAA